MMTTTTATMTILFVLFVLLLSSNNSNGLSFHVATTRHNRRHSSVIRSVSLWPGVLLPTRVFARRTLSNLSLSSSSSSPSSTSSLFTKKKIPVSKSNLTTSSSLKLSSSTGMESDNDKTKTSTTTTTTTTTTINKLKDRLLKISNIASMLCVIDCTVLPIVTILLPLIGLGASASQAKFIHELGHSIALFFVLPVGGLAASMNYLSSKNNYFFTLALFGLSLIYAANGHGGPILSLLPHDLAHSLHCGTFLHRSVNIIGCACLLSSNYFAHRLSCNHDHHGSESSCGHDHSHGGHHHHH